MGKKNEFTPKNYGLRCEEAKNAKGAPRCMDRPRMRKEVLAGAKYRGGNSKKPSRSSRDGMG